MGRAAVVTTLVFLSAACGTREYPDMPPVPADLPYADAVVYLIGDAGLAVKDTPVIAQLRADVAERSQSSAVAVAFLGDNIYEHGMHEPSDPYYERDVSRLEAQIDVVRGTSAVGVFVPGNHDWGYGGERGLANVRRQNEYLSDIAGTGVNVTFLPKAGCPGPVAMELGASVLLIMIETDLWLRGDGEAEGDSCANRTTDDAAVALRELLQNNAHAMDRDVVVLAHHPLMTFGPHGGYYDWQNLLFPGTNLKKWLYVPFPFIYPIVRNMGVTSQDIKNGKYRRMRDQLIGVFDHFPEQPLVYAAGHEHSLQVYEGSELGVGWNLVSGAGSRLSEVSDDFGAEFVAGKHLKELGYMRLEFLPDGRVLLTVFSDGTAGCKPRGGSSTCRGESAVRYWRWLTAE